jgi:branched-chain amino acid transport system permease protein
MEILANLLPHLVNGISLGLLFALIALGFMLIVGVMETINLAHGSLFALGMYVALFLIAPSSPSFLPPSRGSARCRSERGSASRSSSAPSSSASSGCCSRLCMRRTYGKDPLYGLLLTFGAALVIEELIRLVWGSNEKQLPLPDAITGAFAIGDLLYARYRLFASGFAIVMIGCSGCSWSARLRCDDQGRRARQRDGARARHQSAEAALLRLRARRRARRGRGVVMAPIWGVRPHVGVDAVVPAFLIIVLGGVGSLWGAGLGGLLVGMVVGLTAPMRPNGRCCRCTCSSSAS